MVAALAARRARHAVRRLPAAVASEPGAVALERRRRGRGAVVRLRAGERRNVDRHKARLHGHLLRASGFAVEQAERYLLDPAPVLYANYSSRVQGYCFALNDIGFEYGGSSAQAFDVAMLCVLLTRYVAATGGSES